MTRRILVLTAEMSKLAKEAQTSFYNAMIELGLLTVLTISLVLCLHMLRQRSPSSGENLDYYVFGGSIPRTFSGFMLHAT